ncbi:MAG TPA: Fic family protein, partial [archaeon]|nr:Fic family protein [archaeon]
MVKVERRIVKGKTYYYLEHSVRKEGKVSKKRFYLGKELPKDLEKRKVEFLNEVYKEKWFTEFDELKKAHAKKESDLPPSAKDKQLQQFSIRFTYDSNRIEGSTLSLKETADLLERGVTPREKPVQDVKEAEAHDELFKEMLDYKKDLSLSTVLYWHKKLLEATKLDIAGVVRRHQVRISRSKFVPPLAVEVEPMLSDFFKWYEKSRVKLHPAELAALVHLKFVTIHPFADGNGRISRLLMNFVLNKHGFPMLNIH